MTIVTLLILVQLCFILWGVLRLSVASWVVSSGLELFGVITVIWLVSKQENPSYKLAWVIVILALPIVGIVFYLTFGNKKMPKKHSSHILEYYEKIAPHLAAEQDAVIKAAAVADYRPAAVFSEKVKKSGGDMSIPLEQTDDILSWLGEHRREGQFLCGFSMETENLLENSRRKLEKKHIDMIVANNLKVEGAGFGTDTNVVTLITAGAEETLEKMSKDAVAHKILDRIF